MTKLDTVLGLGHNGCVGIRTHPDHICNLTEMNRGEIPCIYTDVDAVRARDRIVEVRVTVKKPVVCVGRTDTSLSVALDAGISVAVAAPGEV